MSKVKPGTLVYLHTRRVPGYPCPACGRRLDGATCLSLDRDHVDVAPADGDLTCCAGCGAILAMAAAGWQVATTEDLRTIAPELRAVLLHASVRFDRHGPQ